MEKDRKESENDAGSVKQKKQKRGPNLRDVEKDELTLEILIGLHYYWIYKKDLNAESSPSTIHLCRGIDKIVSL